MRHCLALVATLLPIGSASAQHAFVEAATRQTSCWVHQSITLTVRIGVDRAFFAAHAIPIFRRETDLPLLLDLTPAPDPATLRSRPGARTPPIKSLTLAWDDDVVEARQVAERVIGGKTFTVLELERVYVAEAVGEVTIPAPRLRYAHASQFTDDFLNGRVAVDRKDESLRGEAIPLTILALPTAGRPPEFTGAVGTFTISAEFAPRNLAVGEIGKLVLRVQGTGNLDSCEPPRLDALGALGALGGFHVYGSLAEREPGTTTARWTYELAPLREVLVAIPRIRFGFFDPDPPAGYRVVQSDAIQIVVRPLPAGKRLDLPPDSVHAGPVPGIDDIHDLAPVVAGGKADREPMLSRGALALVMALPWMLAAFAFVGTRLAAAQKRRRRHARDAFAKLATSLGAPGANAVDAFAEFLARHLDCTPGSIVGPGLGERLHVLGLRRDLVERTTAHLDELVAGRYAGAAQAFEPETTRELGRALHDHWMREPSLTLREVAPRDPRVGT